MGEIPESMHDIAKRDSRAGKQPTQSTSKENGNADFSLPGMSLGTEIGGEAQVAGSNHDRNEVQTSVPSVRGRFAEK